MNLIGLILIAALSGGIVVVSLRLRAPSSSERMWMEGGRLSDEDRHPPTSRNDRTEGRTRTRFALAVNRFFSF